MQINTLITIAIPRKTIYLFWPSICRLRIYFWSVCFIFVFEIHSVSESYSLVHAADTVYCTVPTSRTPQHEALLREAIAALTDHDPITCLQLFANGRNQFQTSADYKLSTNASFGVSFSGVGIQCEVFATVYFEKSLDGNFSSGKRECALTDQPFLTSLTTNTTCVFLCYSPVSLNGEVRVTLQILLPNWAHDSHKLSYLCDFELTQD